MCICLSWRCSVSMRVVTHSAVIMRLLGVWNEWTLHPGLPLSLHQHSLKTPVKGFQDRLTPLLYRLFMKHTLANGSITQLLKGAFQRTGKPERVRLHSGWKGQSIGLILVPVTQTRESDVCLCVSVSDWWYLSQVSRHGCFIVWEDSGYIVVLEHSWPLMVWASSSALSADAKL